MGKTGRISGRSVWRPGCLQSGGIMESITRTDLLNAIEKIGLDFDRQKYAKQ